MKRVVVFLFALNVVVACVATEPEAPIRAARGTRRLTDIAALPVTDPGAKIHYEGSIDRNGYNGDYYWGTFADKKGEWVLLQADGAGCIFNMVQHRYRSGSKEPVFRFYFDGETTPRFEITPKEFGEKAPFLAPLSGRQTWYGNFRGRRRMPRPQAFYIVRSFCPMEFTKSVKVTSSIPLEGIDPGGWGHIHYHTYPTADGLKTFDPNEDFSSIARRYEGSLDAGFDACSETPAKPLAADERRVVFTATKRGAVTGVEVTFPQFRMPDDPQRPGTWFDESRLTNLWVEISFDGKKRVEAPIGLFYGMTLAHLKAAQPAWRIEKEGLDGNLQTALITVDLSKEDAFLSNRFPMPFWENAEIALVNRSAAEVPLGAVAVKTNSKLIYDRATTGYFTSAPYSKPTPARSARNVFLGQLVGRGQLVYSVCSAVDSKIGATCEGDVRLFLDTLSAPTVQSDGTETWGCWGMGFDNAPRLHPFSFYMTYAKADCQRPGSGWSLLRETVSDCCYFDHFMRFELEHGPDNNIRAKDLGLYSGQVFAYLKEEDL